VEEEPSPQTRLSGGATTEPAEEPGGSGGSGPREGLILLLFTLVTLAASGFLLYSEEQKALDDPAQKAARGDVQGLDELSLVREKNFRRVLSEVKSTDWPRVSNVRLAPEEASITAQDADGIQRVLTYDPGFEQVDRDFGTSTNRAVPTSAIDPGAPERMVRAAIEKSGQEEDALDYVTTTFLTQRRPTWTIAFDQGPARNRLWIAEYNGRDVRRVGEPSQAQKDEFERNRRRLEASQKRLRQRTTCLSQATSAQQASRCLQRFPP
jgi:hypothetical protein